MFGMIFVFSSLASADVAILTLTKVYFEKDGEEYDDVVQYSVNCYGYMYADNWWDGGDGNEVPDDYDPDNPEKVYSYSATCPEYGCEIYESYYTNYRHIDYCDLIGLIDGEYFEIENIPYKPVPVCEDANQFDIYDGDNYYKKTDEYELCIDQNGYDYDCEQYAEVIDLDDLVLDESGYPVDMICEAHFDISDSVTGGDMVFTDVVPQDDFYTAINYVESEGIVNGYGDGTFGPSDLINRADFVKILMEAVYSDSEIGGCDPEKVFSDVPAGIYFADYVCIAVNEKIVTGYSDGTFLPGNYINFAEAAKVIVKAFDYDTSEYDDAEWFTEFVSYLQEHKAIPKSVGTLGDYLTRGEMAEMIYRLLADVTNKNSAELL